MADISIPPFTTILLILGAVLILLSLAGQITVKQLTVGISQRGLRILAGIIGVGLIAVAVWLFVAPAPNPHNSLSSVASPAPVVAATPTQKNIPLESYDKLRGKWEIIETVVPPYGNYEIVWNYNASVLGNRLTMQGNKTKVNEPGNVRPLRPDEKATVSVYTLDLNGLEAEGTANEKDPNGVIVSNVKIRFSEDLKSLSGTFQTGGSQVSTLMGSKQQ